MRPSERPTNLRHMHHVGLFFNRTNIDRLILLWISVRRTRSTRSTRLARTETPPVTPDPKFPKITTGSSGNGTTRLACTSHARSTYLLRAIAITFVQILQLRWPHFMRRSFPGAGIAQRGHIRTSSGSDLQAPGSAWQGTTQQYSTSPQAERWMTFLTSSRRSINQIARLVWT